MPSSDNASEVTLTAQAAAALPKKTSRRRHQNAKGVDVKLFEKLGKILVDDVASFNGDFCAPGQLERASHPIHPLGSIPLCGKLTKSKTESGQTILEQEGMTPSKSHEQLRSSNLHKPMKAKYKKEGTIFTLHDIAATDALRALVARFGKVSHMGILDTSYSFFLNKHRDSALHFKVRDKVAVVSGDPLCEPQKFDSVLEEFSEYRKQFGWSIGFLGATSGFAAYAQNRNWVTMRFGVERVLNPMTNSVLLETRGGKRIISQSKQLLRNNITLGIYRPTQSLDPSLQEELVNIYETWCFDRNHNKPTVVQAYLTVYDPFAMPELMTYIYTRGSDGKPCGFAALRKIVDGYHIDPCIALPGSPRGISELLIISAMALLHRVDISHLSLGIEPSLELGEITSLSKPIQALTRSVHRRICGRLLVAGKKGFHDKFRPDDGLQRGLYLVFPKQTLPGWKHTRALIHTVNISMSKLIMEEVRRSFNRFCNNQAREEANKDQRGCGVQHLGEKAAGPGEGG